MGYTPLYPNLWWAVPLPAYCVADAETLGYKVDARRRNDSAAGACGFRV